MIGIFLYGVVVFGLVCGAIWLVTWGMINEQRDRTRVEQGREVFGETAAAHVARQPEEASK